jgi:predicted amidohydrolase
MSTLTITTIQTDLTWEDKQANLRQLEEKIHAIEERTEIIVLHAASIVCRNNGWKNNGVDEKDCGG